MKYIMLIPLFCILLLSSCSLFDIFFGNIGENALISECGGFKNSREFRDDEFCADERLIWEYDQEFNIVHFCNENIWLNCCGRHSISITKEQDTYIIDEKDEPELFGGRCLCMCFFDFAIDLPNIQQGVISVELYRHITDEGSRTEIWQGEVDLTQNQGEILIQANIGWCD